MEIFLALLASSIMINEEMFSLDNGPIPEGVRLGRSAVVVRLTLFERAITSMLWKVF